MPRLNLKDESLDDGAFQETGSGGSTPPLRDVGSGGGGGLSPIVLILLIIAVLGLGVFALNHFGVVHLWGKKTAQVAEAFPEPVMPEPGTVEPGATGDAGMPPPASEQTPQIAPPTGSATPSHSTPAAVAPPPPSGSGEYTIQVSSWANQAKAEAEAARLASGGYSAFVEEGSVAGTVWYRVRVGRYATEKEAKNAIVAMQPAMETDLWVARVGR